MSVLRRARYQIGLAVVVLFVAIAALALAFQPPQQMASAQGNEAAEGLPISARAGAEQEVPTIEPSYTKVYGTETLAIQWAAISPDGRWIAFTASESSDSMHLWMVSAEGGEAIRLTRDRYWDDYPVWFPGGDRLAFRSNRGSSSGDDVMTLPVNPNTGEAAGPPQQVTLEGSRQFFDVSPDGRWIAYTPRGDQMGTSALKVLPASGGRTRTLISAYMGRPVWSSDGASLFYVTGSSESSIRSFMRIPAEGGNPERVFTWPDRVRILGGGGATLVLREISQGPGKAPVLEIANVEGNSLGRLTLPRTITPRGLARNGREIIGVGRDVATSLRFVPVGGGPMRQLTEPGAQDEPIGWTPDSEQVLFKTQLNGSQLFLLAPLAGGSMRQVKLPEPQIEAFDPVLSGDGLHLMYAVSGGTPETAIFKVFSLEDGSSWEIGAGHVPPPQGYPVASGAGGTRRRDGEAFLYYEERGDRYELRAAPPQGPSRVLTTFPSEQISTLYAAVHGDKIASTHVSGTRAFLSLATPDEPEARTILSREGAFDFPVWSLDGRWIAVTHMPAAGPDPHMILVEVAPSGEVVGDPRRLDVPLSWWWNPRWLPDGRGVVVMGMDSNVWLVPVDPSESPVALTTDDPNEIWSYVLSPDGRNIAYASASLRGSSIWRVDLGEAVGERFR